MFAAVLTTPFASVSIVEFQRVNFCWDRRNLKPKTQYFIHTVKFHLGLEHSQIKDSIMYPFYGGYKSNFKLHKEDITKIQGLYGDNGKIFWG